MKRITSIFIALTMMLSVACVNVSAATSVNSLSLTRATGSGDGWTWDGETLTLSNDLVISSNTNAVYVYANVSNVIIDLNGYDLEIYSTEYAFIFAEDDPILTITGSGSLTMSGSLSLSFITSQLILKNNVTVTATGYISLNTLVIEDGSTLNGLIKSDKNYTVYGDFIGSQSVFNGTGALSFAEGSTLTIPSGSVVNLSDYEIDFTNANIIVEDGGVVNYGNNATGMYFAFIDSLTIDEWAYTEEAKGPIVSAHLATPDGDVTYTGEIIYAYYEDEDCKIEVEDITVATAGTYYVKATIATSKDDNNYVTMGTYAIEEFEILTKYCTVSIDGVEDEVEYGTVVTLETLTKDGYTFNGWVDEDGEVYTSEITVTADISLSSSWSEIVADSTDDTDTDLDANTDLDEDADVDTDTDVDSDTDTDVDTDTEVDDSVDTFDTSNTSGYLTFLLFSLMMVYGIRRRKRI